VTDAEPAGSEPVPGLRSPLIVAGATIVVALALAAVLAPVLAPYDPTSVAGPSLQPPSGRHLLGTNDVGQDILSQILWGARVSLAVALLAPLLAVALGVFVGVGSGLVGGAVDRVVTRALDVLLAVPVLPLLVAVAALVGSGRAVAILAIGLLGWPRLARVVRSQTLTLRRRGFVNSARGFAEGPLYVIRRHLAPALGPLIALRFVDLASVAIFLEAGLAFLGLGDPHAVSWGNMLNRALGRQGLYYSPVWAWWVLPAGLAISLAILGFALLLVGLEPVFNPRWRRAR
jgi:peptide/nickel transport system permease protein